MFRILYDSTTADAADLMDNYYHVFKGSIEPKKGVYLRPTTSVCNVGSDTYKWNNAFIDKLNVDSVTYTGSITSSKIWELCYSLEVLSTTARIEISGLNGDSFTAYRLVMNYFDTSGENYIHINGNSGSSTHEKSQYTAIGDGSYIGSMSFTSFAFSLYSAGDIDSRYRNHLNMILYPKTGSIRLMLFSNMAVHGSVYSSSGAYSIGGGFYISNTSSTIMSIVIVPNTNYISTGTSIRLYRRP